MTNCPWVSEDETIAELFAIRNRLRTETSLKVERKWIQTRMGTVEVNFTIQRKRLSSKRFDV